MSKNRFATGEVTRIPLSDDEWIEVKKDLNNGDSKKLEEAGLDPPIRVDGKIIKPINWERYEIERAAIFLTDWNFRDGNNKEMPLKRQDGSINIDMLKALNPEDFDEINSAILKHTIQRAQEKNALRAAKEKEQTPPAAVEDQTSTS